MSDINLKGIARNALNYTGIVTLSQYINGKKYIIAKLHNEGGKPLFDFFAHCLAGEFDMARLLRPSRILLLNKDSGYLSAAPNTEFVRQLSNPEKVSTSDAAKIGAVRYSFIVSQDLFSGTNFNAIGLYSETESNINNYSAIVDVNFANVPMSISSVLVLDWELHISNG